MLPLAAWVWGVYLFWRALVPFLTTLSGPAWMGVRLIVFFLVLHEVIGPAFVVLFQLDEDKWSVKALVTGISLTLMLIF